MAARKTKAEASQRKLREEPAPHIVDLSFNNAGRAFKHPTGFDAGAVFLNARQPNSTAYKKVLAADTPEDHAKSRVEIELSEKETLTDPPPDLRKYLLVGWVPFNTDEFPTARLKNGSIVGNTRPADDEIITFNPEDKENLPLMAVVKVTGEDDHKDGASVLTYVLLLQHTGTLLCTPFTVSADEVYYLSLFRDNTTTKHSRKGNWNRLVSKYAVVQQTSSKPMTAKQAILRHARDQSKLVLPPTVSLKNEINALVAGYKLSGDMWCLDELQNVLESVNTDLTLKPPENQALHKFVTLGGEALEAERYTQAQAKAFVDEMRVAWPDITLEVMHVCMLGQGVQLAQITLNYEHLQSFLREGVYRIRQAINTGDLQEQTFVATPDDANLVGQLKQLARDTKDTIDRILGFAKVPACPSASDERELLVALKNKLKEIVKTDNEFTKMLKSSAGDQALGFNYQDIWGVYSKASDTDSARAAFMDVVKYTIMALRHKEAYMARVAEGIVDILEQALA